MRKHITPEMLQRASELRAAGASWNSIARELGVGGRDTIRYRLDDDFARRKWGKTAPPLSEQRALYFRPTEADVRAIQDTVPRDTRNFTARVFGDPLPGRSALDRRLATQVNNRLTQRVETASHG